MFEQINAQSLSLGKSYADAFVKAQTVALESFERITDLQIKTLEDRVNAAVQFWSEAAEVRDFEGARAFWPKGVQLAKENAEKMYSTSQEIFGVTMKTTDALGHKTAFWYTDPGMLRSIEDPLGHATGFGWSGANFDQLSQLTDPTGNVTRYVNDAKGRFLANAAQASRKDARDAVKAARAAFGGWSGRTAYNRGQVVYRIAEVLEGRRDQFEAELRSQEGVTAARARTYVDAAVDRLVWYAGWADKIGQVTGSANAVAGPYFNHSAPEPTGVVAIVAPPGPLFGRSLIDALDDAWARVRRQTRYGSSDRPFTAEEVARVVEDWYSVVECVRLVKGWAVIPEAWEVHSDPLESQVLTDQQFLKKSVYLVFRRSDRKLPWVKLLETWIESRHTEKV